MRRCIPRGLPAPLMMLVNEEGLLEGLPMNTIGSILYGTQIHGQPIVGNIVIMKEGWVNGEPDIVGLEEPDILWLREMAADISRILRTPVQELEEQ